MGYILNFSNVVGILLFWSLIRMGLLSNLQHHHFIPRSVPDFGASLHSISNYPLNPKSARNMKTPNTDN